jgi:tetratricopeptide (TPR) repeat protein
MSHRRLNEFAFITVLVLFAAICPLRAQETTAWADFQQKAAAWRALPVKPAISEDVRRERVLAENNVNEKEFISAVNHYESALKMNPVWPEGHFNAALIYAELKNYDKAVWHMRAYVELLPGAPDAQGARDQIIIWQDYQENRWYLGTWSASWSLAGGTPSPHGEITFSNSNSGDIESFGFQDDGTYGRNIFRGTIPNTGGIRWKVYLNPVLGCCPSGWQPVISWEVSNDKRTLKIVVPSQWASESDSRKGSLKRPNTWYLTKVTDSHSH